ncbi:aminotransferase class I/II-fold pyridoxal phosphate-dependent enzyme [bacterium]|nr:aminotransferase class I/II-fold pyridoxal phosphate-dependent enzyme [bacterium]
MSQPFPQARRAVQAMKAYLPPLEGRRSRVRLDFNENTQGFPEHLPDFDAGELTTYPEYTRLLQGLSRHLELPEEYLLITNGSDEGLFVTAFTFVEPDQDRALVAQPTFALIPHYLQLCQAVLEEVPNCQDLRFDLEGMEAALRRGVKMAILATPDNPTGAVLPLQRLRAWLRDFPETLFVIDEAYYEYYRQTALPLVRIHPNLVVSRTFSKAWGMAGLRLGFLAAHPQLIEWMRRVRSPYSVNALAVRALLDFLPRSELVQQQADALMVRKNYALQVLNGLGYRTTPGAANFFLIWAGLNSKALSAYLYDRGMLVRDRSSLPKMSGSVRVSVGSEAEMERLLHLLAEFTRGYAIIFDLDDTLVDTSQSYDTCISRLTGCSREQLLELRAEGGYNDDWDAAFELLRRDGRERPLVELQREGQQLYLQLAHQVETALFEEAHLQNLAARHPLFIYTGRPRQEFEPIWAPRLAPHFRDVLCKDDAEVTRPKPHPDGLHVLMARHRLHGGIYVGNSVDDMVAAKAAGLTAVGVTTNQSAERLRSAGADYIIEKIADLPALFLLDPA